MTTKFNYSEALKLAIEKEKESQLVYRTLNEIVDNLEAKKLFTFLYNQELFHEKFFANLLRNTPPEKYPRPAAEDEYAAYIIEQLNANKLSAKFSENDLSNIHNVFDFAISREKDAVIFYVGLRELMLPEDQNHITDIIWQEAKHAIIINNLREKIFSNKIKL